MAINRQILGTTAAGVVADQESGSVGINNDIPQEALDVTGSIRQSGVTNAPVLAADANGKIVAGELTPNLIISTSSTPTGALASKAAFEAATGLQTYMFNINTNTISIGVKTTNGRQYTISGNIFDGNTQITSITDTGELAGIEGTGTFKDSSLQILSLPGLKTVGYSTFKNCTFAYFYAPALDASYTGTNQPFEGVATTGTTALTVVLTGTPFTGKSGNHFKANSYT